MVFNNVVLELIWGIISTLASPERGKEPEGFFVSHSYQGYKFVNALFLKQKTG